MAYRKKSWIEKHWRTTANSLISFVLGASIVTSIINVQQKPSSQEIEASQKNATMMAYAYSVKEFNDNTALGHRPVVGMTVAVSPDRADLLDKAVYIQTMDGKNIGRRKITDLMSTKNKNSIDILVDNKDTALKFGSKPVRVIVIEGK